MLCPSCGAELLPSKAFCHVCGARVAAACPQCSAPIESGWAFCPDCGHSLQAAAPEPPSLDAGEVGASPSPPSERGPGSAPAAPIAGERKQVTVLFCDLVGSTAIAEAMDPEEYRDLLDGYLKLAIREIDGMGGFVNQLAGDGFMSLFGAPRALENEAERALRAALGIQEALERHNREQKPGAPELRARIGIHSGPVVVGTVGADLKLDYTAIGDTTNLAARLQDRAEPGSILISEVTRNLATGQFELRELPPVQVKGKSDPVAIYQVLGFQEIAPMAIAEARGLTPLVGLREELALLEACFDRIQGDLPQMVSVLGHPGSGKSRVVHEFKQRIRERDPELVVLEARASALTESIPFAPLRNMLNGLFDLVPGEDRECACDKIAERLRAWGEVVSGEELAETYPAICELLTVPIEELPPEGQRQRIMDAFGALMRLITREARLLVILEDLHWFDEASLAVVERHIASMERWPIMVLVTHRPDFEARWPPRAPLTQLPLRAFSEDESREIVRARAGGRLPPELEDRIIARGEGNPFFLEEITRALVEQGLILRRNGGVDLTGPVEAIQIPDTVQELIEARLDRLSPAAKRLAQVAAVVGRQFRADHLHELLSPEQIEVESALEELVSRGLVHGAGPSGEYRFGESLTQTVCYEALLLRERRELHERVAQLIETYSAGLSPERVGLMAHHLARSENRGKAIESLLAAAAEAEELPSYPSAAALYRQAWELAEQALVEGTPDEAQRWVLAATMGISRVVVLYISSDRHDEERAARRGVEMAGALGDEAALARMLSAQGTIVSGGDGTRFGEGLELMERGLGIATDSGHALARIHCLRGLGFTYLMDGRFEAANRALETAAAELASLGHDDPPSDLYLSLGYFHALVYLWQDDLGQAREIAQAAHESCNTVRNRTLGSATAGVLALVHFQRAEYSAARDWADRALATAQEIGNIGSIRTGATVAMASRRELGERIALSRYLDALEPTPGSTLEFGVSGHLLVEILVELGELERAVAYASEAAVRSGGRLRQMQSLLSTGRTLRDAGSVHRKEAEEEYRLAAAVADEIGSRSFGVAARIGLGQLAAAAGDQGRSGELLLGAADDAAEAGLARLREQALRALASAKEPLVEPEPAARPN